MVVSHDLPDVPVAGDERSTGGAKPHKPGGVLPPVLITTRGTGQCPANVARNIRAYS